MRMHSGSQVFQSLPLSEPIDDSHKRLCDVIVMIRPRREGASLHWPHHVGQIVLAKF